MTLESVNRMPVQRVMKPPILKEAPDRRRSERFVHREPVLVDGRSVMGCDLSPTGICVIMQPTIPAGTVVRVTVAGHTTPVHTGTSLARVVRVDARLSVVGLEFMP